MRLDLLVRHFVFICAISFLAVPGPAQSPTISPPPATPKRPVNDVYHGVKVTEDYRWLEDWNAPEVKEWSAAQNARTRQYLDHLPSRPAIKQRLTQLVNAGSGYYFELSYSGGTLFAMKGSHQSNKPFW